MPKVDQAFELDGFDLRAILFALEALLRLLVIVEFAVGPLDGAVERIDGGPEEIVEVGIEARIGHGGDQGVEDVGDGAFDDAVFRHGPGIGFVFGGPVAVELKLLRNLVGRRCGVFGFVVVVLAHGMLRRLDRDRRGLHGDEAHGRGGLAVRAKRGP